MKQKIRMIAMDLDGTLLNSKKELSDYTKEILRETARRGIVVLPATGRPISGLPTELLELSGIRYVLTANGARLVDRREGKTLYERLVPHEIAGKLLDIFRRYDTLLEIYFDGICYADQSALARVGDFLRQKPMADYILSTRRPVDSVLQKFTQTPKPSDKVQAIFCRKEEMEEAGAQVAASRLEVEMTGSLGNNIEVNARGVSKGESLLYLGRLLGIGRNEIMAFGDGGNDVSMLRAAGVGVAMENSIPAVKEAADEVALSNDEDGVADMIERYVLR